MEEMGKRDSVLNLARVLGIKADTDSTATSEDETHSEYSTNPGRSDRADYGSPSLGSRTSRAGTSCLGGRGAIDALLEKGTQK
jgi:hypothetical protein